MADRDTIDVHLFRLASRTDGGRAVVAAHGELDLGTVEAVERAVQDLRRDGATAVVLDFRALTFIDSSGLRLLLRLDADARAHGWALAIAAGDGPVRRLLELTNLIGDFEHAELS
jgi:anti-sigma B factor antagonist